MTLSDLDKWRKYVPLAIFGMCILPWFLFRSKSLADAKLANELVAPIFAMVAAFFYVGLDLRRPHWTQEIQTHVGKQIQEVLLGLIPKDLAVTDAERNALKDEVLGQLAGVFWETINNSEALKLQKEHFYSNGIIYSTSLDVYLICGFSGFAYAAASLLIGEVKFAYVGALLIAVALASRALVTPRRRAIHIALSREQLDFLEREQGDLVANRFREIVTTWRLRQLRHPS